MILRVFEEACKCLTRIHQAGVCHFDIKSDNILVRSSAHELSRILLDNDDEEHAENAPSNGFKGWLCFADFGESKVVDADRVLARTFTFSSFSSGVASPVAVQKRAERFVSLSRTRGTEAIKSPEVLKIKGSEEIEVKVTLASDIWSLGCLLYELVTQELLFQNDDWAGLYAHLVVTQDQHVLRADHKQKMISALQPTCSDEEAVVTNLTELCSKILVREPTKRPKLETIGAQVRKLVNDVHNLPVPANDESLATNLNQSNRESSEAPRTVAALQPFSNAAPSRNRGEDNGVIVPVRLFWNFFIAAEVAQTQNSPILASCLGSGQGPASKDVLVMEAFESKYEADFVHFVYLSWSESAHSHSPSSHERSQYLIEELHEEEHRTCFLVNPGLHLFQQLIQHACQYFPVLQRRLREEAGSVLFVALGKDGEATRELQHVLTGMLLFFLRSAFDMAPFDVLRCFARDCAQFFDYPRPEFMQHLTTYSVERVEGSATSSIVQCRCGASVLTIASSVLTGALASQHCTCKAKASSTSDCPCFHPFPVIEDQGDSEDDVYPIDAMFVHDAAEERLVQPLETRSKRRDEVRWVSVDVASVGRTEGSTFRCSRGAGSKAGSERRMSRLEKLTRRVSRVTGKEVAVPHELVRGLQRRGKPSDASSSDSWELYECQLCRLPLCALSEDKVAVPILHH
ncbi:putative serine/threonine-protein kinase [Phytophthora ramorum]|uniref:putative serine/threonine-protein kinase n=1 Tax=Phytophthora ramorum TaxID=164328 RepID=UPI00309B4DF9|nr:putative serine/threonine-protein kinase [Phytophthora ramorum]